MKINTVVLLLILLITAPISHAQRYALIIGNSDYKIGPLKNPVNDANDMATLLRKKEFLVEKLNNATEKQMNQAIRQFTNNLHQKNAIGLFYYAGHGVEVDGRNYLIPIDANIENENDVKYESVDAGRIMDGMERAGNNLNLVILDACRNNPFARSFRSVSRGLAKIDAAKGSLVLYATSPGDVASDGKDRNGLFTQHLMASIDVSNLKVEEVFKQTAKRVYNATNGKQLPWQSGVIIDDFYFSINAPNTEKITIVTPQIETKQAEIEFWNTIKSSQNPEYFQAYLDEYGNSGQFSRIAKIKQNELTLPPPGTEIKPAKLTIQTFPKQAKTRILNITAKYYEGITLKPGHYHIEVTHPGFQPYIKWLELGTNNISYLVELTPLVSTQLLDPLQNPSNSSSENFNSIDIQFIFIKPGCFQMGTNEGRKDERPAHKVCIKQGYSLGKFEVTQAQWQKVMSKNPARFKHENKPIENVSWNDIQRFIHTLNQHSNHQYRLPTEAEWEYACRSGEEKFQYCGSNNLDSIAWHPNNTNGTQQVGLKKPNSWGLYDMSGNVEEWVQDWYAPNYYINSPSTNPDGPKKGPFRVFRGGGWFQDYHGDRIPRVTLRGNEYPYKMFSYVGFRLVKIQ